MNIAFNKYYIKKITKYAILLHIVLTVTFAFVQMPQFMQIMRGIDFNFYTILMVMIFKTLEWINAILMVSFILVCFYIFYIDVNKYNLELILIQMGKPKNYLYRMLIFFSFFYSAIFFYTDGFVIPNANYSFKQLFVQIAKEKFIKNLVPKQFINFNHFNILFQSANEDQINYLILNHDLPALDLTIFIKKANFFSKNDISLDFLKGKGFLKVLGYEFDLTFEKGLLEVPASFLEVEKTEYDKTILELNDFHEILWKCRSGLFCMFFPYWIISMVFSSFILKIFSITAFFIMFFQINNVIEWNFVLFFLCWLIIILIYRRYADH